jgi:hypothetical protein
MLMSLLAMLVSNRCVLLGLVMLAESMMRGGLMVVMSRGVVVRRRLVMVLARWMFG